jgi:hypothetical protein
MRRDGTSARTPRRIGSTVEAERLDLRDAACMSPANGRSPSKGGQGCVLGQYIVHWSDWRRNCGAESQLRVLRAGTVTGRLKCGHPRLYRRNQRSNSRLNSVMSALLDAQGVQYAAGLSQVGACWSFRSPEALCGLQQWLVLRIPVEFVAHWFDTLRRDRG